MIISKIIGGLGNQMFQYATGRALSLAYGEKLSLDISSFASYKLHNAFELQRVFNCPVEIATEEDMRNILGWQCLPLVKRIMERSGRVFFRCDGFVVEPHFHYWQGIRKVPKNSYLSGNWQSEKYFSNIASVIHDDFTFKADLSDKNAKLVDKITQTNAVSLHIRRGDYVDNPKANAIHGLCTLNYYKMAIQYIAERVAQPAFFVFSDDINWAKSNIRMEFPCSFVDHNQGNESYNDMRLMSLCQHNILANSSFSWWGAWLNSNPKKIVIAPEQWFNDKIINTMDLLPTNWIRLPNKNS